MWRIPTQADESSQDLGSTTDTASRSILTPSARPSHQTQERARPQLRRVGLLGTGSCLPERVLTNHDLEQLVDTSDEWIFARTGVRERRLAGKDQAASDLATVAAQQALAQSELDAEDVELIIVATVTPDNITPHTACHVQRKLGAVGAAGFDLSAACSGFANALHVGHSMIATGSFANALVIGVDVLSKITDFEDRNTCVLFGDGAGATVLGADPTDRELLDHEIGIDGTGSDLIIVPAGGSAMPASQQTIDDREHYIHLHGRKVFRFAVSKMCELVEKIAARNQLEVSDIDLLIPHQANRRIIDAAAEKLGLPTEKVFVNVDRFGNTSAASIPMALDEAVRAGRLQRGDMVCTVAFGAGLSWGANLIAW